MTVQNTSELLSRPVADLLEAPISEFRGLLRNEELPDDPALSALEQILMLRMVRLLGRRPDADALREEIDGMHRLIPHRRREEMDRRGRPWAARWAALTALLEVAAEALSARDPERVRQMVHAAEILREVDASPGLIQGELAERLGLKPANLSRIVGVLEANELLQRRAVGREKRLFPADPTPTASFKQRGFSRYLSQSAA